VKGANNPQMDVSQKGPSVLKKALAVRATALFGGNHG